MLPVAPERVDNWVESGDGESRTEREREREREGQLKEKQPLAITEWFSLFFLPLHSSFRHAALNHLCS